MDASFYPNNIFSCCLCISCGSRCIWSFISQYCRSCLVLIKTLKGESWVVSLCTVSRAYWYYLSQMAVNKLLFINWSLMQKDTALLEQQLWWQWQQKCVLAIFVCVCVCKYPRVLALCSVSRDQNSQKRWCLGFNTEGDRENVEVWRRRWRGKNSVV